MLNISFFTIVCLGPWPGVQVWRKIYFPYSKKLDFLTDPVPECLGLLININLTLFMYWPFWFPNILKHWSLLSYVLRMLSHYLRFAGLSPPPTSFWFSLEILLVKVFEHITSVTNLLLFSSHFTPLPLFVGVDKINLGFAEDELELALEFGNLLEIILDSKVLTRSVKDNFPELSVYVLSRLYLFWSNDPPSLSKRNVPSEAVWILNLVLLNTFLD